MLYVFLSFYFIFHFTFTLSSTVLSTSNFCVCTRSFNRKPSNNQTKLRARPLFFLQKKRTLYKFVLSYLLNHLLDVTICRRKIILLLISSFFPSLLHSNLFYLEVGIIDFLPLHNFASLSVTQKKNVGRLLHCKLVMTTRQETDIDYNFF